MKKRAILVSSCLLLFPYRYDGKDNRIPQLRELEGEFRFITVCPEVSIGLGVPRPPIKFVPREGGIALLHSETAEDVESDLAQFSKEFLEKLKDENLSGAVLKSRSPSCGLDGAKVYRDLHSDEVIGYKEGVFARTLREFFSDLPVITEEEFLFPRRRREFLEKVRSYRIETF